MEKEDYSIDDILSEVKKRREENEAEIKKDGSAPAQNETANETTNETDDEAFVLEDENAYKNEDEREVEPEEERLSLKTEEETEADTDETEKTEAQADESEEADAEESPADEAADTDESEAPQAEDDAKDDEMVDLLTLADERELAEQEENGEKVKFFKTKKGKVMISVITVLVVLIIGAGVFAFIYANDMLNKVTDTGEDDPYEAVTYYDGMDFLQEDFPTIEEMSADQIAGYQDYLKQWYENGDPVSSTHVLNILLIGEDTRDEDISDASRADSAIICSINIDTQEITLTSILRDLYVYYEVDGAETYGKINESASNGGMKTYITTLERYYKMVINNYAVVNFASFPKIIDSLGGISIDITSVEIAEINNHPKRYGGVTITQTFEGTEGTMELTGEQALAYCRIRKIDSDVNRADRQKTVLMAIFKEMKSAGTIDIAKTVANLVDYVYTGYSKSELIEIGNTALKDGWLSFEIVTDNLPSEENRSGGKKFSVCYGNWIWLSDIPEDAYNLQMQIYGKSNITLNENRADYISLGV
ncbi:MAG: LCP family protein [Clostridiales bacterium]|nr:LCP family protein [Clostridiales bacterium]